MSDTNVTVYSTTWCGFCHAAKQYFDHIKVKYTDIDVEKDQDAARKMVDLTGQMGVPVITIGSHTIVGFDRPKIDTALREAKLV